MARTWGVATMMAMGLVAGTAALAEAQSWNGAYVGAAIGRGWTSTSTSEAVEFDTTLDGAYGDTVRTLAGANAFSPGFCGGTALSAVAADGCSDDEGGLDLGARVGYDRQWGRLVVGGVGELSRVDITDAVTAFSTTPAFYTFTRQPMLTLGLRARVGIGMDRWLVYGTAGPAWTRVEQRFTSSNMANVFVPRADDSRNDEGIVSQGVWGVQAGGGAEVRVAERWTVVAEYLYSRFDDRDDAVVRSTRGTAPATNPFVLVNPGGTDLRRTEPLTMGTVRVGIQYRF